MAEVAELDKAGAQREVDAGAEQQINQHRSPQNIVYKVHQVRQGSLLLSKFNAHLAVSTAGEKHWPIFYKSLAGIGPASVD